MRNLQAAIKDLKAAKALLVNVGWVRGSYKQMLKGKCLGYCTLGAVMEASELRRDVLGLLHEAVEELTGRRWRSLAIYNDGANRKKEQILSMFYKAIAIAEERLAATS